MKSNPKANWKSKKTSTNDYFGMQIDKASLKHINSRSFLNLKLMLYFLLKF